MAPETALKLQEAMNAHSKCLLDLARAIRYATVSYSNIAELADQLVAECQPQRQPEDEA